MERKPFYINFLTILVFCFVLFSSSCAWAAHKITTGIKSSEIERKSYEEVTIIEVQDNINSSSGEQVVITGVNGSNITVQDINIGGIEGNDITTSGINGTGLGINGIDGTGANIDSLQGIEVNVSPVNGSGVSGAGVAGNGANLQGINGTGINGNGINGTGINGNGINGTGINGTGINGNGINGSNINSNGVNGDGVNGSNVKGKGLNGRNSSLLDIIGNGVKGFFGDNWEGVKSFGVKLGRGVAVGVAGAGVVAAVVGGIALLLGTTIAAPVLIAGLAVGTIAGVAYSFVSGNDFSWIKGVAVSGTAALATIGIGQAAAGAIRAGGTVSKLITLVKGHVLNTGTVYNFGFNTAMNFYDFYRANGETPTKGELVGILGVSALSALAFDKAAKVITSKQGAMITRRITDGFINAVDSWVASKATKKDYSTGTGISAFLSGSIMKPFIAKRIDKSRAKKNIGTTLEELYQHGISPEVGKKTVTNRKLDELWNDQGADKTVLRLLDKKGQVTQKQMDKLLENKEAMKKLMRMEKGMETGNKIVEDQVEKVIDKGIENVLEPDSVKVNDVPIC